MRVLYINNTKDFPGSSISLLNLIKGLKSKGVEILVVGPRMENPRFINELQLLNVDYKNINNVKNVWPRISKTSISACFISILLWPFKLLRLVYNIKKAKKNLYIVIDSFKPDIIHSNSGVIHEGIFCGKHKHIPHFIHLREYQDLDFGMSIFPSKRAFERMLSSSYVITITKDILHHFHLDDYNRAKVIYNGIYQRSKVALLWPKEKYFLCCSRINPSKGHEDVIKAFAGFSTLHPDYKLKILGYGAENYISYLKGLANQLCCGDKIEWIGFVDNPFDYMAKAKALVVASQSEGFGRMTAESAFAGCLVIGRNTGGTREILLNTGGFLFDDVVEMEYAMHQVSALTESAYKEMITKSQSFAREYYSIESNVEITYSFYLQSIDEKE